MEVLPSPPGDYSSLLNSEEVVREKVLSEIQRLEQFLNLQLEIQKEDDDDDDEKQQDATEDGKPRSISLARYDQLGELQHLQTFEESMKRELDKVADLFDDTPIKSNQTHDDESVVSTAYSDSMETVTDLHEIWTLPAEDDDQEIAVGESSTLQESLLSHTKRVKAILEALQHQLNSDDIESVKSDVHASIISEVRNLANLEQSLHRQLESISSISPAEAVLPVAMKTNPQSEIDHLEQHQQQAVNSSILSSTPLLITRTTTNPNYWWPQWESDVSVSDDTISTMSVNSHSFPECPSQPKASESAITQPSSNPYNNGYGPSNQHHQRDAFFDPYLQPIREGHPSCFAEEMSCWNPFGHFSSRNDCCLPPLQSILRVVKSLESFLQVLVAKKQPLMVEPTEKYHQEMELAELQYGRETML